MDELAACLRSWRDRAPPGRRGPAGRRRAGARPACAARRSRSSPASRSTTSRGSSRAARRTRRRPCCAPLARALRLSDDERDHLFRVAGHAEPDAAGCDRHLTPGVQRVLDRLADVPVIVVDAAWHDRRDERRSARALLGDPRRATRERNVAVAPLHRRPVARRAHARARSRGSRPRSSPTSTTRSGASRDDEPLRELIDDLRAT